MAGCCCCMRNRGSTVSSFGAVAVMIFLVGVLICSKEYDATVPEESGLKHSLEDLKTKLEKFPAQFQTPFDKIFLKIIEVKLSRIIYYRGALLLSIALCLIGFLFGLLLLLAPSAENKGLCIAWMFGGSISSLGFLIMGAYILYNFGPITCRELHNCGSDVEVTIKDNAYTPLSAIYLLCTLPILIWSVISVGISMEAFDSGTLWLPNEAIQQGHIIGVSVHNSYNNQMLPQNPQQPPNQFGNPMTPSLYQTGPPMYPMPPPPPYQPQQSVNPPNVSK